MGFRFGERKYSEGLYSRWPDWWHDKRCQGEGWTEKSCKPSVWTVAAMQQAQRKVKWQRTR